MKKIIEKVLVFFLILISVIIILASLYYKKNFAEQDFETLFFNIIYGTKNANTSIIGIGFTKNVWNIIILTSILYIPILIIYFLSKKNNNIIIIYSCLIIMFSIVFGLSKIDFFEYLKNQNIKSELYENNYVANIKLNFPKEKRNLIYIFLESMETSLVSQEEGGGWEYTIIPELAALQKENINFSNTEKLGGALTTKETTCTTTGMVAQTSGVPLKMNIGKNNYGNASTFLPGVYALGDILKDEGYNLEVMFGSNASFGGRKEYFEKHGNYKIFDVNTAIEQGKMKEEDKVWWGFLDDNLYAWAKDEILNLASEDKPFNFIMLTADTHFVDGYLSDNAEKIYDTQYENVFSYSSKCIYEFVKWIEEQGFYKNTTIVLVGDHLGMQSMFYKENIKNKNYIRTVYNVFINSAIPEANSKNRRFCTMDIFPTVLASMGVKIEGDRLGLGTNLFSGRKTLIEEMGYDKFNEELVKKSNYYNNYILQDN